MGLWDYSEPDEEDGFFFFFFLLANFIKNRTFLLVPVDKSSSDVDLFQPLQSSILSGICICYMLQQITFASLCRGIHWQTHVQCPLSTSFG